MDALERALAEREREEYRFEQACPVCSKCGETIQDEYYYDINGDIYCEECLHDEFSRSTLDYVEEKLYG